ncbi:IS256 family transposase [Metallosphaera hakonensis]|uniref:IS256 family transposase n=1 Tax=Metallosphaera hakonensis JCM 8857 = DSM 7519 TaxID=1293036 RepID=A0A2U9IWU5_9CREN|nr:IS256 family transposase [Metallosphaera hakonensis]AWS00338.1 IS256 family transposase [Metallosphaera hakonensis JCM 8857 = DSM 7519]
MKSNIKGRKREDDTMNASVESMLSEFQESGVKDSLKKLVEDAIQEVMKAERDQFLKSQRESGERNYGNGYYDRQFNVLGMSLNLQVPRDRKGQFRSSILPDAWRRSGEYDELVIKLLAKGYSKEEVREVLREAGVTGTAVDQIASRMAQFMKDYRTREIGEETFAAFMDVYHAKVRNEAGKIVTYSVYLVLGVDFEGRKTVLNLTVREGAEDLKGWNEVLQNLVERGLSRVSLFVTDDFRGLHELISKYFPSSRHQLCLVHFERDLYRNLPKEDASSIKEHMKDLKTCRDAECGRKVVGEISEFVSKRRASYGKYIAERAENYVAFLNYPREVRTSIYTNNSCESFFSYVARNERSLSYFSSQESLDTTLFVIASNLEEHWEKHVNSAVKSHSYRLRQIFEVQFNGGE